MLIDLDLIETTNEISPKIVVDWIKVELVVSSSVKCGEDLFNCSRQLLSVWGGG